MQSFAQYGNADYAMTTMAELQDAGLQEAIHRIEAAWRSNATRLNFFELNLAKLNLNTIPDSIACLTNLRHLDLSDNHITAIPNFIAQLANLRSLDLRN